MTTHLSEQQYRILFDTMLQGSVYQDQDGRIIAMNAAAERILGRSMAELDGVTSEDLQHQTLREDGSPFPGAEHPAMVALRTGQPVPNVVMQVFNPRDQAYRWININAVPLFNDRAGQPYQVFTIFADITAAKHAEQQLRQSAALFATTFRLNPAAMSITRTRDGCFVDVNASHERTFGYPREQLIGMTPTELGIYAHPAERDEVVRIVREHGALHERELTLRTRSGELRETLCSLAAIELDGESYMLGIVFDITDRKRADRQVRYQADLLEQVSDAIISTDTNFTIRSWNAAAEALYGWTAEQAIGQLLGKLVPITYVDTEGDQVLASFFRDGRWRGEVIQQRRDGTDLSILTSVSLIKDQTDTPIGAVAVNRDITARKQAEQALRRSVERLRVLADASRAFAEVGPDYQALLDLVVRTTATGLGEGCLIRLISRDGLELPRAAFYDVDPAQSTLHRLILGADALRTDEQSFSMQIIRSQQPLLVPVIDREQDRAATKPEFWELGERLGIHSLIAVPLRVQGQAIGILWLYRYRQAQLPFDGDDLTLAQDLADRAALAISNAQLFAQVHQLNTELEQRVAARTAELVAANSELEAFSYSVSHDLRAPLRAIDGFSQILLEDYLAELPEEAQYYFQLVRNSTQQMVHLIDDLLRFARLSRQPLSRSPVDPAAIIRQCYAELAAELAGRTVELRVGALPPSYADPALLKQVWVNLLANAIKYTRHRDRALIEVDAQTTADVTVYVIRDNGIGFDMRYVGKLFGVFQRLHRAEDYEGTGVGLAIVQRIILRHGGRIWADSVVNQGTTFFFTLGTTAE